MELSLNWIALVAKVAVVVIALLQVVPIMIWVERRGSALMQNRLGPNRVGPLGLLQSAVDAIKMIFKEDFVPAHVTPFYFLLAPVVAVVPAFMAFAVIPFASQIEIAGQVIQFQIADLNVGMLYILSITSLGVYAIIMAGWASNNKYALLGSLRSSSQMISYELSMGLSLIGIVMIFSSVKLGDIARAQGETLLQLGALSIPKWGIFLQPIGFLVFLTSAYAETNRLPFDLPEGESEIVAGYHLEYGAMKFALFMLAEYVNMTTASAMVATLYFGGWQLLPGMGWVLAQLPLDGLAMEWARVAFEVASFSIKVGFFLWLFVWVRWTLPRFRYDQLMDLGWKFMLPLSIANIFVTAFLIYRGVI
jgi:NADH-quinone oxidoreductase subunit H